MKQPIFQILPLVPVWVTIVCLACQPVNTEQGQGKSTIVTATGTQTLSKTDFMSASNESVSGMVDTATTYLVTSSEPNTGRVATGKGKPSETDEPSVNTATTAATTTPTDTASVFAQEELDAWCKDASRPRAYGPKGVYWNHLPLGRNKICKHRFTYRPKAFVDDDSGGCIGEYSVAVVYLTDSGQTKEVFEFSIGVCGGWDDQALNRFQIGDVDGDGTAEVLYGIYTHGEGEFDWKSQLLTLKEDKLVPMSLPNDYTAEAIKDVDKDGLFDVITNGPYAKIYYGTDIGGAEPWFSQKGLFIIHSLGGTRFSMDDELAVKKIKKSCPQKKLPQGDEFDYRGRPPKKKHQPDWRNPLQIVCARVYGTPAQKVKALLWTQCETIAEESIGGCHGSLLTIAEKEPPLLLTP